MEIGRLSEEEPNRVDRRRKGSCGNGNGEEEEEEKKKEKEKEMWKKRDGIRGENK